MAGSAVIGALRVNLGIDTAAFSNGLKNANASLGKFGSMMRVAMAGAAAAGGAAAAALVAIRGAAERADNAWKASQALGVPIKELGRLTHAAEMSGASFETLQTGIRRASQAISQTADGATNEAALAFERLGVSVKNSDGTLRASEDVINDIADRFAAMPNGVAKTNAAIAIFGRSGAQLIPMLNTGSAGLKSMGDEAERLGLVFDQKTALASERFNDNISRLAKSMTGLWNKVLANVIGGFANLTDRFVLATQEGGQLASAANAISFAMNALTRGITVVFENLSNLYDLFKIFVAAKIVTFLVSAAGAFISLARTVRVAGLAMVAFTSITRAKITALALAAAVIAKLTGTYDDLAGFLKSTGESIMSVLPESIGTGIEKLSGAFSSLGSEIKGVDGQVSESMSTYMRFGNEAAMSFDRIGKGSKAAAQSLKEMQANAARVFEATRTPFEQYQAKIAELNEMLSKGAITQDTYNRAVYQAQEAFKAAEEAAKKADDVMGDVAESIGSTIGNAFKGVIDGSKSVKDALKDVLASFAQLAAQSAFKSILGGFGGGGGGFLGSLFGGLFGGFRASGGPVNPNRAYMVGERGPEMFVPSNAGRIVSNDNLMGGGGGSYAPVYNIDARGADAAAVARLEQGLKQRDRQFSKNVAAVNLNQQLGRGRP